MNDTSGIFLSYCARLACPSQLKTWVTPTGCVAPTSLRSLGIMPASRGRKTGNEQEASDDALAEGLSIVVARVGGGAAELNRDFAGYAATRRSRERF